MKSKDIEGKRLVLKNWKLSEASDFVELTKDPKLIFGDMPYPYLMEHARFWIKKVLTLDNMVYFAIHEKVNEKIIGFCWITLNFDQNQGLIVYALNKESRGKGYATEAASLMREFAFNDLKLSKLVAETKDDNFGSHNVLKKLGFRISQKEKDGSVDRITGEMKKEKWYWELENTLLDKSVD